MSGKEDGDGGGGRSAPGMISRRTVHEGRVVGLAVDRVRFPDGSEGEKELVLHSGASAVLPFLDAEDAPDPAIVLIRQYRYAAGGELWEIPAGRPSRPGEPWEEVAARELREETGYAAERLRPLTRIFTAPGFTDEVVHLFAAAGLTQVGTERDEHEFMEVVSLPLSQAVAMVRQGEIIDAKTVAALLWVAGERTG
jgi:ADP-ribose pyrophosphatase